MPKSAVRPDNNSFLSGKFVQSVIKSQSGARSFVNKSTSDIQQSRANHNQAKELFGTFVQLYKGVNIKWTPRAFLPREHF